MPQSEPDPMAIPAGWPAPVIPADDPVTTQKVQLGRQLFYETRLSKNDSLSCSSCHAQSSGFCDAGHKFSTGIGGQRGTRNAPSLVNLAYGTSFFWDGRAHTLEEQATGPILNPVEMGNDSLTVLQTLSTDPVYPSLFAKAFGDDHITMTRIADAIASFERTFISANSPYDRYMAGDASALSSAAVRGMKLFFDTTITPCSGCHHGVNFTDEDFYSTGFTQEYRGGDKGRMAVTGLESDRGKFKPASLRNVSLSAPYTANGGTATLLDMVKHYNDGGAGTANQDPRVRPLNLTDAQMQDIVEFLQSLTDPDYIANKNFAKP